MGSSQDMGSFDELEPIVILDEEDDLTPKAEPRLMVPKREKTEEEQEQFAKELNVGRSSSSTRPPLFEFRNLTLNCFLSALLPHCHPPQKQFPFRKGVSPPWWPTGKEDWWSALWGRQTTHPDPPPYQNHYNLKKDWKVSVLQAVFKHMSPEEICSIISSKRLLDKMSTTETAAWLDVINNNEEEVLAPRTMKNECEVEDVTKPVPLGNEDDIGHEEKSSWEEDNNNMDASSNNGVEDPYFGTIQTTANVQRPLYELNANGNLVIESLYDDDDDASVSSDEYLIYDMKFIPSFYH